MHIEQRIQRAVALHQNGRLAEAETSYLEILERRPGDPELRKLFAVLLSQTGRLEASLKEIGRIIEGHPRVAEYQFIRAGLLRRLGRGAEAEAAYRRVLDLEREHLAASNGLALLLLESKRAEEALELLQAAHARHPTDPTVRMNLGHAMFACGNFDDGLAHMQQGVRARGNCAEWHLQLARALARRHRYRDALGHANTALSLNPRYAQAHLVAGEILQSHKQFEPAREHFEFACKLLPDQPEPLLSLAGVQRTMGDTKLANQNARRVLSLDPINSVAFSKLAQNGSLRPEDEEVEAVIQALPALGDADPRKPELMMALGHVYDAARDYPAATARFREANRIFARDLPDIVGEMRRIVTECEEVFADPRLILESSFAHPSEVPVFVVGMPRSGSTLVEQILAAHPEVFGVGELEYLDEAIEAWGHTRGAAYPGLVRMLDRATVWPVSGRLVDDAQALAPNARRMVNKNLGHHLHVGLLAMMYPAARFIHIDRSVEDVAISCYSRVFLGSWWKFTCDMEQLSEYVVLFERLMKLWYAVLPGRLLRVRYEKLVADPEAVVRGMLEFLGLDWDPRCLDFHTLKRSVSTLSVDQVRRGVHKEAVRRWHGYRDLREESAAAIGRARARN